MRIVTLAAAIVALAFAGSAPAATRNGITPLTPKAGSSVPAGKAALFRMRVSGPGKVFVHVCKNRGRDSEGVICRNATVGEAKRRKGVFRFRQRFYDFPTFWLNNRGRYYWQAYRVACSSGSDCKQEGPVTRFRVR